MYYRIFLLIVLLTSCNKEKFYSVEIYGHGGNGVKIQNSMYHDNSKESIDLVLSKEGVDGVEIDVRLSADGELWIFHDDELSAETNGTGCVEQKTFAELSALHYTTVHKEKLAKLADLPFQNYGNKVFFIDARHYQGCDFSPINYTQFVEALKVIQLANPAIKFVVVTRFTPWMQEFTFNGFEVYYEIENMTYYSELVDTGISFEGVVVKNSTITKEEVAKIHSDSRKVIIFEIRSPKNIRKAMKKQPDGIQPDDVNAAIIEKY